MSSTASGASPAAATVHRTWVPLFLIALVLGTVFTSVFVGLQRTPEPRGLPLAIVGGSLATSARAGLGDAVDVIGVPTGVAGDQLIRRGEAVGVVEANGSGALRLDYAGGAGLSESAAAQRLAGGLARAARLELQTRDVLPLANYDARGLVAFYVVFGVTLSSFILAQLLAGGAVFGRLRHQFAVLAGFAVVIGLVAATIAGPVYGALPAPFPLLGLSLVLLSVAVASATTAMAVWLGPPGISLAVLLFTILGNATSGATIGFHLLPTWAQVLSSALPNGAATRLIQDFGYFGGSGASSSVAVLLTWAIVSIGAVALHRRRAGAHRRVASAPAETRRSPAA